MAKPTKCSEREVKIGEWNFFAVGLLSGTTINFLATEYPASDAAPNGYTHDKPGSDIDIASYKTLIYRTILDIGAMEGGTKAVLQNLDVIVRDLSDVSNT
jgi:hypothetical protein